MTTRRRGRTGPSSPETSETTGRLAPALPAAPAALLLGLATGARSSLALAAPLLSRRDGSAPARAGRRLLALAAVAGEFTADKLPGTPSRMDPGPLGGRIVAGAGAGAAVARRAGGGTAGGLLVGGLAALAGAWLGSTWRRTAARAMPDWVAAVAEDAVAVVLAAVAVRTRRG